MDTFVQLVLNGLMLGGLFAIISVGLTLIFGIIRLVNFAHGELLMVGMYLTWIGATKLGVHPYLLAPPVVLVLFVLGLLIQRFILQPLLEARDAHVQIFATVGLSTALINLALLVFGADLYATPSSGVRDSISFGPYRVLVGQLVMFVCGILVVTALHLFMERSYLGRAIRATAQHRAAAQLMGVDVKRIYMVTFGIGAACVGVAAVLVAPIYPTSPTVGTYFVLTAFVVVVLGGMGSLHGAFVGALIIGLVDSLSGFYIAPDLKEVVIFALFIGILLLRPTGLFGLGRGSE
ncbi:branched-chain amino acid ABC transporter permease [Pseudoroseomonas ludipueritiae]|uniref:Branched-chain amino acid ABC transporter permease n=1 Tax=Pseudoroseomonas ludipueritiae TaxID=198093 RepID=A0ABR7R215_9PROT|nr:branched-chain amino acid ABC transporter permease [Pseudoroseomonas ludipueritiae]MBC9175693.1 branched-chain amino acid ABC transporter permease [Pseudoroseomonas ludipueritiae]